MTKRAILYARVSNRSQDERGLSVPAQFAELRAWCDREGVRVIGQVADTGGKGSKRDDLERAGLDELYDTAERLRLVEDDVVIAQSWDRFGEDDVPGWIGRRLASVCGARLRTPDDPNEGDDDGADLLRLVGQWNAGRERRLMARRTRSRKLELARTGHIVPSHTPTYGFAYAGEHKARHYEVHEGRAAVVRRIFAAVADGTGIRTIVRSLDAEGVPLPPGKKRPGWRGWNREFVRNLIRNDVHLPHTDDALDALVASGHLRREVRSRAAAGCGIWWYTGKDYEGDTHAVAVPVPSVGVPRATVERARGRLASNRPASSAAGRLEASRPRGHGLRRLRPEHGDPHRQEHAPRPRSSLLSVPEHWGHREGHVPRPRERPRREGRGGRVGVDRGPGVRAAAHIVPARP